MANHDRLNSLIRAAAGGNRITTAGREVTAGDELTAGDALDEQIRALEAAWEQAPTTESRLPIYRELFALHKQRDARRTRKT